jgi:hypothetical protein
MCWRSGLGSLSTRPDVAVWIGEHALIRLKRKKEGPPSSERASLAHLRVVTSRARRSGHRARRWRGQPTTRSPAWFSPLVTRVGKQTPLPWERFLKQKGAKFQNGQQRSGIRSASRPPRHRIPRSRTTPSSSSGRRRRESIPCLNGFLQLGRKHCVGEPALR